MKELYKSISKYMKNNVSLWLIYMVGALILYVGYITFILPNSDTIWNSVIYKDDIVWNVICGRYMISLWQYAFGCIIPTESFTVLSLMIISIICVILVDFFDIKGRVWQILAGLVLITAPCI